MHNAEIIFAAPPTQSKSLARAVHAAGD
jgi:hypothetical protein